MVRRPKALQELTLQKDLVQVCGREGELAWEGLAVIVPA